MTYLILEIWAFVGGAALVGMLVGALLRGGSSNSATNKLKQKLAAAEATAKQARQEAADAAVAQQELQMSGAQRHDLESQIHALTAQVGELERRNATLQQDLNEQDAGPQTADPAHDEDKAALEQELESARAEAAAADGLRGEITRLIQERDTAKAEAAEAQARADEAQSALEAHQTTREAADEDAGSGLADLAGAAGAAAAGALAGAALAGADGGGSEEEMAQLRAERDALKAKADDYDEARAALQRAQARVEQLESELANASTTPADNGSGGAGDASRLSAGDVDAGEGVAEAARLRWRNRYLSSRVRHLEERLADADAGGQAAASDGGAAGEGDAVSAAELRALRERVDALQSERDALAAEAEDAARERDEALAARDAQGQDGAGGAVGGVVGAAVARVAGAEKDEDQSLEWRNRYLASRVRYLEERLEEAEASGGTDAGAVPASDAEDAERVRRLEAEAAQAIQLRERVNDLERDLAQARATAASTNAGSDEAGDDHAGGASRGEGEYALEWRNRYLSSRVKYLEERLAEASSDGAGD